jgi:hypothetical protein
MAKIMYTKGNDGGGWVALPEGTYDVRITSVEQGASKAGNPQLTVKGEVMDGPSSGKNVTIWYSLLPQSTWKLDALLNALSIPREETGEYHDDGTPVMTFDSDALASRVVRYNVTQRDYNGKTQNDYKDEQASPLDTAKPAAAASSATAPQTQAGAPAAAAAAAAPGTVARRPRPAGVPS